MAVGTCNRRQVKTNRKNGKPARTSHCIDDFIANPPSWIDLVWKHIPER